MRSLQQLQAIYRNAGETVGPITGSYGSKGFDATDRWGRRRRVTMKGAEPIFDNPKAADLYRDHLTLINTARTVEDVRFAQSLKDRAYEAERGGARQAAE